MRLYILSGVDVRQALPMSGAIEAMKGAFVQLSSGQAVMPLRMGIPISRHNGLVGMMPGYLPADDQVAIKIGLIFKDNASKGLPLIQALVVGVDAQGGDTVTVMEGGYLTALRTGAASGAATDLLAPEDARTVAVFGAGVQGRTQLEAVCTVRAIQEAWIYNPGPEKAAAYADEMSERLGLPVRVAASPGEAVRQADVICTATTSADPIFDDADVRPGTHINGVGAHSPHAREIPAETIQRAKLVIDQREACLAEAGDLLIPLEQGLITQDHIYAELGEIAGGGKVGRTEDDEITLFKSVGVAVQDVAAAGAVVEAARGLGLGTEVEL
jgi:ornithine cyclodeaminase/alanine dehydrogenase-like protein (mu-crystallin family)